MFKNMIGRRDTAAAQPVQEAAAPAAEKKKASTVQVTVRLRPEQHRQLKDAAFHRDCDMSELVLCVTLRRYSVIKSQLYKV